MNIFENFLSIYICVCFIVILILEIVKSKSNIKYKKYIDFILYSIILAIILQVKHMYNFDFRLSVVIIILVSYVYYYIHLK